MQLEKIDSDLHNAMKARDEVIVSTLRMLKAAIKNKEIEKKVNALTEQDLLEVIQKQVKQRKDSIADFEKASRIDLATKEKSEITVLERYLPKALSDTELKALIQKAIQSVGAKTKADMGKVMKEVMRAVAGRADGKQVNQIASSLLI